MHLYEPAVGFLGTNGVVAAGVPMAAGAALSAKLRNSGQVAVCFFGDGAVNNGAFHEGINLAASMGPAGSLRLREQHVRHRDALRQGDQEYHVSSRAAAYNIPGIRWTAMTLRSV